MTEAKVDLKLLELFGEWWFINSDGHTYQVKDIYTDEDSYFDEKTKLNVRGPYSSREMALEARYYDGVPSYWAHGLAVYANHCVGCGKFAKVIAGDDVGGGWSWRVTWCKQCGFVDSRKDD